MLLEFRQAIAILGTRSRSSRDLEAMTPMTESIPTGLRIDAGGDQFPVSGPTPRLSWLPVTDATRGYELSAVVDDGLLESAATDTHRLNAWPWRPLRSGERVRWRVRPVGGEWSEEHSFEAGLFEPDWTARWISPPAPAGAEFGKRPAHSLRVAFTTRRPVVRARL